jgi:LysM repeat protein
LEDTKKALEDLSSQTKSVVDSGAEVPMRAISKTIALTNRKLEELKTLTKEYDEKYKLTEKVSEVVNPARERAQALLSALTSYITELSNLVFSQLKGVNDGLKSRLNDLTQTSVNFLIKTAATLDTKYNVEDKLKEIDERYSVTEKLEKLTDTLKEKGLNDFLNKAVGKGKELDAKFTDGKATETIEYGYSYGVKMVSEGLEKLHKDFDMARKNSRENLAGMANLNGDVKH